MPSSPHLGHRELLGEITKSTNGIRALDSSERTMHERTWVKRAELVRAVQMAHDELSAAIYQILGTADHVDVGAES